MNLTDLLGALAGVPRLDGALCRGRPELWDEAADREPAAEVAERHAYALAACGQCPALTTCAQWLDGLKPSQRPPGVTAGRLLGTGRRGRPPKQRNDATKPIERTSA